ALREPFEHIYVEKYSRSPDTFYRFSDIKDRRFDLLGPKLFFYPIHQGSLPTHADCQAWRNSPKTIGSAVNVDEMSIGLIRISAWLLLVEALPPRYCRARVSIHKSFHHRLPFEWPYGGSHPLAL